MEHYISKSALLAEIERLKDELKASDSAAYVEAYIIGAEHTIKTISDVIDTLEVKEIQVKESAEIERDKETCKENGDSLTQEPVSEELEEAAEEYIKYTPRYDIGYELEEGNDPTEIDCFTIDEATAAFIEGAKWQKEHLWKPADGDDLPEYDREVIAILDYDFGHYKVVYAHRPNPNGWNGTNIDTGEKEHFEPVIYDKGGWNQPHVLYWLDAKLPYEEK